MIVTVYTAAEQRNGEDMKYIVRSRQVFDAVSNKPESKAILIEDKKIEKILPWDAAESEEYQAYPLKDYGDKLILPSFMDAHTHVFSGAVTASDYVCDTLGECKSQEECVEMIKAFADAHPDLKRIRGTGWFVGNWDNAPLPDKRSLDAVLPDIPVYLQCADCHSFWMNTKALEEAGIKPDPDFPNGIIGTFENGELSGLLMEPAACEPANEKFMDFTKEELLKIHRNFQKVLSSYGISAVSEMFANDYVDATYESYDLLKEIDEEEGFAAHVYAYTKLFGYTEFSPYFKMKEHYDSPHFHIAGLKGFIDGVTETYTGLLLEPYTDKPETCGEGLPLWPKEKMQQEIIAANKAGIQVRLHCIADGSVRMALDMYEESVKINGERGLFNTIEHIENIHPADIDRFAKLRVIPSMQPYHVTLSNNDKIFRIGAERCEYEWPVRTIHRAGGEIAIGTDFPVVTIDPFKTIYAAVTRRDDAGNVVCHNPWETLEMAEALKAYTTGAAKVYHADKEMGTLEEGKLANLIVLSDNLFEIPTEQIEDTKVVVNIFEGKEIYAV